MLYRGADADSKLVRDQETGEWLPCPLPVRGNSNQVRVLRKENPTQFRGSPEQFRIDRLTCAVFLTRENIHTTPTQPVRDSRRHMDIHVQAQAHALPPCRLLRSSARDNGW